MPALLCDKLDDCTREAILVGYKANGNRCRLWDPINREVYISRSVAFDKGEFPLKNALPTGNDADNSPIMFNSDDMDGAPQASTSADERQECNGHIEHHDNIADSEPEYVPLHDDAVDRLNEIELVNENGMELTTDRIDGGLQRSHPITTERTAGGSCITRR